jgi:hypothetical protein
MTQAAYARNVVSIAEAKRGVLVFERLLMAALTA